MPIVKKIIIYPIKSLSGIELPKVNISGGGSLLGDREFAIVDNNGKYINGKKNSKIYYLRTDFNLSERIVTFKSEKVNIHYTFNLDNERKIIEEWLTEYFQQKVSLIHNVKNGFPDDLDAYGPTLVSEGSLIEISKWFPEISIEELEKRFRPNIIINSETPFWEDRLTGNETSKYKFEIGLVDFYGVNVCQRCSVPSKSPLTGNAITSFQKIFAEKRKSTLPIWANKNQFDHYYRLCINTKIPLSEAGKVLSVGHELKTA